MDFASALSKSNQNALAKLQATAANRDISNLSKNYTQQQESTNPLEAFFKGIGDRVGSIGNALGTTGAAVLSGLTTAGHKGDRNATMQKDKSERDAIAKKYGYADYTAAMNAGESAPEAMWKEFQGQSSNAMDRITDLGNSYKNNFAVKHIANTDQNKFGSDAIKTLSTASDILTVPLGGRFNPLINSVQGAAEGFADTLGNTQQGEQLDWQDAAKRAAIGATSGAIAGGLANKLPGANTVVGNIARSAGIGASGGAIGQGGMTALNGGDLADVFSSVGQGALYGGTAGGIMGGATSAAGKIADIARGRNQNIQTEPQQISESPATMNAKQIKAQKKAAQEMMDQFGTIPKRVNERVKGVETFTDVAKNYGLTSEGDIRVGMESMLDTGSKIIRDAAGGAGVVDLADANKLINDLGMKNSSSIKKYRGLIGELVDETPSSISGNKSGADALALQRQIEKLANTADAAGTIERGGVTYNSDQLYKIANSIGDSVDKAVKGSGSLGSSLDANAQSIQTLRDMFPNNSKWQSQIDNMVNSIDSASPMSALRSSIKTPTRASIYIDAADNNAQTYGGRTANNIPTSKTQAVKAGIDAVVNSDRARQARINSNLNIADGANSGGMIKGALGTGINAIKAANQSPQVPLGLQNMTSRDITSNAMQNSINNDISSRNALVDQDIANVISNYTARGGNVSQLSLPNQNFSGVQQAQSSQLPQQSIGNAQTGGFGGYSSGQFAAMAMAALQDGNTDAYKVFIDLYKLAQDGESSSGSGTSSLNATQQGQLAKLQSAGTALDQLEQLYNSAGGGQGKIGGAIANFFGSIGQNSAVDSYNQLSSGLINQIAAAVGKTDSLNTEGEVQRALELVPKITDSAEVATTKLNTLRRLLEGNTNTYQNIYGVGNNSLENAYAGF